MECLLYAAGGHRPTRSDAAKRTARMKLVPAGCGTWKMVLSRARSRGMGVVCGGVGTLRKNVRVDETGLDFALYTKLTSPPTQGGTGVDIYHPQRRMGRRRQIEAATSHLLCIQWVQGRIARVHSVTSSEESNVLNSLEVRKSRTLRALISSPSSSNTTNTGQGNDKGPEVRSTNLKRRNILQNKNERYEIKFHRKWKYRNRPKTNKCLCVRNLVKRSPQFSPRRQAITMRVFMDLCEISKDSKLGIIHYFLCLCWRCVCLEKLSKGSGAPPHASLISHGPGPPPLQAAATRTTSIGIYGYTHEFFTIPRTILIQRDPHRWGISFIILRVSDSQRASFFNIDLTSSGGTNANVQQPHLSRSSGVRPRNRYSSSWYSLKNQTWFVVPYRLKMQGYNGWLCGLTVTVVGQYLMDWDLGLERKDQYIQWPAKLCTTSAAQPNMAVAGGEHYEGNVPGGVGRGVSGPRNGQGAGVACRRAFLYRLRKYEFSYTYRELVKASEVFSVRSSAALQRGKVASLQLLLLLVLRKTEGKERGNLYTLQAIVLSHRPCRGPSTSSSPQSEVFIILPTEQERNSRDEDGRSLCSRGPMLSASWRADHNPYSVPEISSRAGAAELFTTFLSYLCLGKLPSIDPSSARYKN
ncbi:unnamed protein product [Nesidiocoris tenuis]|uniref:Uncharacterized protein n=1 Tax=Nesidiocoris tenuis TaxID=355587 RepID=A0A6H5HL28_9HEMI|nr:unnamed protein product [Nesidiocoris tenuis]